MERLTPEPQPVRNASATTAQEESTSTTRARNCFVDHTVRTMMMRVWRTVSIGTVETLVGRGCSALGRVNLQQASCLQPILYDVRSHFTLTELADPQTTTWAHHPETSEGRYSQGAQPEHMLPFLLRFERHFPPKVYAMISSLFDSQKDRPVEAVDYGCGSGITTVELASRGFNVTGLEHDPVALARGHQRALSHGIVHAQFLGNAHAGTAVHLGSTDLVAALHNQVLSEDPMRLLHDAHEMLRPGGHLVMCWNDRDLSHPFIEELEHMVEDMNPGYYRAMQQHDIVAWSKRLTSSKLFNVRSLSEHGNPLLLPAGTPADAVMASLYSQPPYRLSSMSSVAVHRAAVRKMIQRLINEYKTELQVLAETAAHEDVITAESSTHRSGMMYHSAGALGHREAPPPATHGALGGLALPVVTKLIILDKV